MKKSLIVISAAVCIAAACGAYAVLSSTDDKIEMSAKPIQIQAKTEAVQNKDVELYEASINEDNSETTMDTDNDEQQSSFVRDDSSDILKIALSTKEYYSNHERIRPQFTPVKRITADFEELREQEYNESNETVRQNLSDIYGIDPSVSEEEMNNVQTINLGMESSRYLTKRVRELREKMAEDGYCDKSLLEEYTGKEIINGQRYFLTDEYIPRFCDKIIMTCNAYNDPDYEISDVDRFRILKITKGNILSLYLYLDKHPDNAIDAAKEALEYAEQTYEAEYGRRPFEG